MQREAGVEGVVEPHVVDALVDRLLDQQCRHRRQPADPPGEVQGPLLEIRPGEHLADHADPVGLVDVERIAGEEEFLGPAGAELPGVPEVLDAAHPEAGPDDVGELDVVGGHDQVTGPGHHEPGGEHRPLHLGDGDLAEVAPPAGVVEEVVPFLQHPLFGAEPGAAVDPPGGVLIRPRIELLLELR